jgi:quinohemoprotein ethanol dehydrogenase
VDVVGGPGSVPDLRKSSAQTHDLFSAIVVGGLYKDMGMPIFKGKITPEELDALEAYILQQAWRAYDVQSDMAKQH